MPTLKLNLKSVVPKQLDQLATIVVIRAFSIGKNEKKAEDKITNQYSAGSSSNAAAEKTGPSLQT
jgi:hypothetical protein